MATVKSWNEVFAELSGFDQYNSKRIDDLHAFYEDESVIKELIQMYIDQLPDRVSRLELAGKDKKFDELERVAHELKSTSRNLGGERLGQLCECLEYIGESKGHPDLGNFLDACLEEVKIFQGNLKSWKASKVAA